jgi:hypothetical protein
MKNVDEVTDLSRPPGSGQAWVVLALTAALSTGCWGSVPETQDAGACPYASPGNGCLTLIFFPSASVAKQASSLKGTLNWGLYKGGAVGSLGPGNNASLYGGAIAVDFSDEGDPTPGVSTVDGGGDVDAGPDGTYLPNIPAQDYQVLAYLDIHGTGESSGGDPVTLPSGSFTVPANTHIEARVELDYIHP